MTDDIRDFTTALELFVRAEIEASGEPADYNADSVEIIDARNHLFRNAGRAGTDEERGIYAIRDLCRVDEQTLDVLPDRGRMAAIARAYF